MAGTPHDGQDHSILLPGPAEVESWEQLDQLLAEIKTGDREGRLHMVVTHAATLFAGIESPPALDTWPIARRSSATSPRWIETVVGIEIDRTILRILQNRDNCVDCQIAWVQRMIESRITLSEWAWAREADALFGN